jgi:serine/threonine-protein kinase
LESLPKELSQLLGQTIAGRYRLDELLGSGGMGVVFGGRQVELKRPIAVKVLDPEVADSERGARRFKREAESVARLDHVNCLQVYDYGTTSNGLHFMVMPRLSGRPLSEMIDGKTLPPRYALELIEQVLSGLTHAHGQGLVHRDLKPSNIFVVRAEDSGAEVVKIVDFGIAKIVDDDPDTSFQTRTGLLFGTPAYMSPEQAVGEPIDARSDLYTTGIVLYCLIVGDVPHRGMSVMDQLRKRATLEVPGLPEPCPPEVSELIASLSAREPHDRFADAVTARARVREILEAAPESSAAWDECLPVPTSVAPDGSTRVDESLHVSTLPSGAVARDGVETPMGTAVPGGHLPTEPFRDVPATTKSVSTDEEPTAREPVVPKVEAQSARADPSPPSGATSSNRRIVIAAGAVVIGLGLWAWLGMDSGVADPVAVVGQPSGGPQPDAPPPEVSPPGEPATASAAATPGSDEEPAVALPEPPSEPDLLEKLNAVNEADEKKALPYAERHALLDSLRANPKTAPLIDEINNAVLDIAQAKGSDEPCANFLEGLRKLAHSRDTRARKALRHAVVPKGDTGTCVRAKRELTKLRGSGKQAGRGNDETPEPSEGVEPGVAKHPDGPEPGEITPKLGPLK